MRRPARRRRARRGPDRDPGLHPLRPRIAQPATPASTPSSRSRSRPRAEQADELAAPRARSSELRADVRAHVRLQPAGARRQGAARPRGAGRGLLHLLEPRQPRPAPARRQRDLGPRPARLLDPPATGSRSCRRRFARSGATRSSPGIPDVAFVTLRFPSGIVANVELSWLAPSKLRRTVIVGSKKMVVYDDGAAEPVRIFDHGVVYEDPETFGEYQLSYRTGDILSPKLETLRAARQGARGLRAGDPRRPRDGRQRRARRGRRSAHRGRRRLAPDAAAPRSRSPAGASAADRTTPRTWRTVDRRPR